MSFAEVLQNSQVLNASVEALAALGARLKARCEGLNLDPAVAALLDEVVDAVLPGGISGLTDAEADVVLAFTRSFLRQATDLLERPDRPPGWSFDDPVVLQAQGQASRLIVRTLRSYGETDADFAAALVRPAAFLDVGTGVGWFAIEAARAWPSLNLTGIDILDAALELARTNVEAAGLSARIALRRISVDAIDDRESYDFVWFSGPFVDPAIVPQSLKRLFGALRPGGRLIFGTYNPPPAQLGRALAALRTVRSGGRPWTPAEAAALLADAGFAPGDAFTTGSPILVVIGRKP